MRTEYGPASIAQLYPADATPEEEAALVEHENKLMRSTHPRPPYMVGALAGKIFAERERRAALREARGA